jgi:hypothetical protein
MQIKAELLEQFKGLEKAIERYTVCQRYKLTTEVLIVQPHVRSDL